MLASQDEPTRACDLERLCAQASSSLHSRVARTFGCLAPGRLLDELFRISAAGLQLVDVALRALAGDAGWQRGRRYPEVTGGALGGGGVAGELRKVQAQLGELDIGRSSSRR